MMDRITAFTRLINRAVGSGDDEFVKEVEALVAQTPPIPPTASGVLGGKAADLAHHVEKNGYVSPEWGSEQMQRLIFRMTQVLEAFEGVVDETAPRRESATATKLAVGARLLEILGKCWEMGMWEETTTGSIMEMLMFEAQFVPVLRSEMNRVDARHNALVEG